MNLKIQKLALIIVGLQFFFLAADAQYKSFSLSVKGDTLNAIDKKGMKQCKWVIHKGKRRERKLCGGW